MKKIYLLIAAIALIMSACNSNKVKVRGDVKDLVGTVKLLAEMPGQQGMVVLAQQEVTDGKIDLETEQLQIPARVWIDIAGKNTLTTIIDSKDYELKGISEKYRKHLSHHVMHAVNNRIDVHMEIETRHPMEIRRYYRRLEY